MSTRKNKDCFLQQPTIVGIRCNWPRIISSHPKPKSSIFFPSSSTNLATANPNPNATATTTIANSNPNVIATTTIANPNPNATVTTTIDMCNPSSFTTSSIFTTMNTTGSLFIVPNHSRERSKLPPSFTTSSLFIEPDHSRDRSKPKKRNRNGR